MGFSSLLLVTACAEPPGTDAGETAGDGDGDGDGEPRSGACTVSVVDHTETCADGCPIISDLLVTCDDDGFGDPGLRVAPNPDDELLYFVTSGSTYAWFGALTPDGGGEIEQLPPAFAGMVIAMAQDSSGAPYLAADRSMFGVADYLAGASFYDPLGGAQELVFEDSDTATGVISLEFDSQGRAHVWIQTHDERILFVRDADAGVWQPEVIAPPENSGHQYFGLNRDDGPVSLHYTKDPDNSWRLYADEGTGPSVVSGSFGPSHPGVEAHVVPPASPDTLEIGAPGFVVFTQHESGFRLAALSADGYDEHGVLGADAIELSCLAEENPPFDSCPETCDEVTDGLFEDQASVARTADGRVWAAWAITHVDQSLAYTENCGSLAGCSCSAEVTRDDSWGELVLAQVDIAGHQAIEVMRVQTLDPELSGLLVDTVQSSRSMDMRAFGDGLAIGLRTRSVDGEPAAPDMRMIQIDTALIP